MSRVISSLVSILGLFVVAAAASAGDMLVAETFRLEVPDGYDAVPATALQNAASAHAAALCSAAGYRVSSSGDVSLYAKGAPGAPASLLAAVRLAAEGPVASVAAIPPEWLSEVSRRATGADAPSARKVLVGTRGAVPAVEVRGSFDRGDQSPNPARSLIVPRRDFVLVVTLEGVSAVGRGDDEPEGSPWSRVLGSLEVLAPAPAQSAGGDPFPFVLAAAAAAALLLLVVVFLASRRSGDRPVALPPPAPSAATSASASGTIRAVDGLPTFDRRAAEAREPAAPPPEGPPVAKPAARPAAKPAAKPIPPKPPRTGPARITGNDPVVEGAPAAAAPERSAKISRNTDFLAG